MAANYLISNVLNIRLLAHGAAARAQHLSQNKLCAIPFSVIIILNEPLTSIISHGIPYMPAAPGRTPWLGAGLVEGPNLSDRHGPSG
jgi:hypothetical protein